MSNLENKIEALGLSLSAPKAPVGNYLGCKRSGELLFASARVSDCRGEVGTEVSLETAQIAARDTVLSILAIIKEDIQDLDLLTGVLKMTGFVRSASNFTEHPKVIDGASDLLIQLLGEKGRHARTATGVAQLPFGASVQLDIIFQIK
ncbi:RidA family protein [Flavobacterium wongokense]|uniref:RidA family protein n=1 Tax=Flavobacterium wongokense TaxID=2910674 RepID=UPI001F2C7FD1|nr:RidA family protein [Flavobacterium sp. WG47]MCF6132150.1 RidA family protein [Flavobacterium sp. WG47]